VALFDPNDTLSTPDDDALDALSAFTAAMWIQDAPIGFSGALREFYPRMVEKNDAEDKGFVIHGRRGGGAQQIDVYVDWPNGAVLSFAEANVEGWHHWAVTYDSAAESENLKLYVDGELLDAKDLTGTPTANDEVLGVASSPVLPEGAMSNIIDDFRFYNEALSQEAIRDIGGFTGTLSGDFNGDGNVDTADYTIWADNYTGSGGTGGTPSTGDANGDGAVDTADYTIWADNYTGSSAGTSATIPEPTVATLLLIGALGAMRVRVRRCT
jgi:hypothetical protein